MRAVQREDSHFAHDFSWYLFCILLDYSIFPHPNQVKNNHENVCEKFSRFEKITTLAYYLRLSEMAQIIDIDCIYKIT